MIDKPKPKPKRHKMTVACEIPQKVRDRVHERDKFRCVICGEPGLPNAHYISRAHGGLGIEQNIFTACPKCHHEYDNGDFREAHGVKVEAHLRSHYPNFDRSKLIYDRWKETDPAWRF